MTGFDIVLFVILGIISLLFIIVTTLATVDFIFYFCDRKKERKKRKEIEQQEQRQLLRDLSLIPYGNFAFRFPDDLDKDE